MAIKRRDFQKLSSTVQEFLLKLPDEESSARLRDNLLHALHFLQLYYRLLQNRDRNTDTLQWTIDHSLSPLTPFREAPDKFEWEWLNVESQKVRQNLPKSTTESLKSLPKIICAIREGNLEEVKEIVQKESSSVNSTDLFTRDCVTYAIQFDQIEILKYLLENGANINNIASDSSTSLHRAVYKSNPSMVELLLEHKANINAQDCYNRSPLHWSVVNKSVDCLKVLLKYKPNIHIKDKDGMSPSMWACHLDHLEHLKMINNLDVNKKIDLNNLEQDNDGRTWLHWSIRKNEPLQCLNFLLNNQNCLLKDKEGKTCLHVAAEQGAIQASKLILEIIGTNIINEIDNKKQTPLHLATLNGHARGIKILMDNGADPNQKDITGASPIDYGNKRNLFFCSSIIEICLKKTRAQGASSSNSIASSFNGSESNLTPAPPTTPKNSYSRSFQSALGKPPRPVNMSISSSINESFKTSTELSKTAPAVLNNISTNNTQSDPILIPPSPPTIAKTRPNLRGGWNSTERILSGSLRLSRASTRTSLASDDLDKYMNENGLNNNTENLSSSLPNTSSIAQKPLAPPRVSSSSYSGRMQDTPMSTASFDSTTLTQAPPPIKPRKSSSVASLNNSLVDSNQTRFILTQPNNNNSIILNKQQQQQQQQPQHQNKPNDHLNVEDLSDNELSITSVKGEGFASDLSDNETKADVRQRVKSKRNINNHDASNNNPKRPNTPMDFRATEQNQPQQQLKNTRPQLNQNGIKFQQFVDPGVTSTRFNEWDPYAQIRQQQQVQNERQKSPLKQKQQAQQQQFLAPTAFLDSSPRQSSGRLHQIGSAVGQQKLQSFNQNQTQFISNQNQIDMNSSSSNLDLVISGQKLGARKDSPTNTPRESSHQISAQSQSNQQARIYSRRLQPLDKNSESFLNSSGEGHQFMRQKTSKVTYDRKKLEPIRNMINGNSHHAENQNHSYTHSHSMTETDGTIVNNDDEPSISETTLSSDKQQSQIINNLRAQKKKSAFNRNRNKFVEPIMGNDEALKM